MLDVLCIYDREEWLLRFSFILGGLAIFSTREFEDRDECVNSDAYVVNIS